MLAFVLDSLTAAAAGVATDLALCEHAGTELLTDSADAVTVAGVAAIDFSILAACALTGLADVLLLPCKLRVGAVVEVAKGDLHAELYGATAWFSG